MSINYGYCGLESGTNTPLIFFGVADAGQAAPILEQAAAAKPYNRAPENSATFLMGAAHTRSRLL